MIDAGLLVAVVALPLLAALLSLVSAPRHQTWVGVTLQVATFGVALTLIARTLQMGHVEAFANWLYLDSLSGVVMLVIAVVCVLAAVYSVGYLRHELRERVVKPAELRKYFFLFHLFVFAMLLVTISGNLGLMWTAISATTLASAPLVDFYGSHEPLEAAWKYIVLTVAGSLIALLGMLLLYQSGVGALGTSFDFSIPVVAAAASHLSPTLAATAFLLVLVGFGTKAGLAPMHTWLPDASQSGALSSLRDAVRRRAELRAAGHLPGVHAGGTRCGRHGAPHRPAGLRHPVHGRRHRVPHQPAQLQAPARVLLG